MKTANAGANARIDTSSEAWRPGVKVGDRVRFAGRGASVLDHGPGIVRELTSTSAYVEVLVGGKVLSTDIRAGERYWFATTSLEVVSE